MKQKIAILTHYYKSKNYGGNLQAYALCKAIERLGYQAEQISFNPYCSRKKSALRRILSLAKRSLKLLIPKNFIKSVKEKRAQKSLALRYKAYDKFNQEMIPHTTRIYTNNDIGDVVDNYDYFITGSDQVWNFKWYNSAYYLDFVPSSKIKLSYSASLSMTSLTDEQREIVRAHLKDYDAVSVREREAQTLLEGICPVSVEHTLDPTLLLDKHEWVKIASKRQVSEPYIFCYFLGNDETERALAKEYAKKTGLRLVTLPYLENQFRKCDEKFGDIQLFEVGPEDFVSLIMNAEMVFTDSFHATVFSLIFEKNYFVFERAGHKEMGSRIHTLTKMLGTEERFCDSCERLSCEYLLSIKDINYEDKRDTLIKEREKSYKFLKESLERLNG